MLYYLWTSRNSTNY